MKKPNFVSVTIIRTHNFSAKMIHVGMWIYAALRGKKITKSFNHSEVRFGRLTSGAYAVYDHTLVDGINSEQEMIDAYGVLYNWYAVDDVRGLSSEGHVPTDTEFMQLTNYLIDKYPNITVNTVGNNLKSVRQVNSSYFIESGTLIRPKDGKKLDASHIVNLPSGAGLTPKQAEDLEAATAHIDGEDSAKQYCQIRCRITNVE